MLNAKKIGVIVVTVAVAGTLMFFGIKANRSNLEQNVENTTSIGQIVEEPVETETGESAVKDDLDKGSGLTEEEKNIDEVVTTIDEVEADEQGQLAANAGGSGEAEMAETNEEDVYTDMGNEEVPEEEKVDLPEKTTINENDGGSWGFESYTDTDSFELPSEERRQEISDKIDEYGTVLH